MQADRGHGLPRADNASRKHSERVCAFIRQRITAAGGSLSFAEFMHHALYAPGLGYYAAGNAKFGPAGDFVTAPEVSALYAPVVARQVSEILRQLDGGEVLELGAGSGVLAAGILKTLQDLGIRPTRYGILEVAADLRERQQRLLEERAPDLAGCVEWLDGLPQNFSGVIIANEVADALPVERFVIQGDEVRQYRVGCDDGGFAWQTAAAPAMLQNAVRQIESEIGHPLADGFESEVSMSLPAWTRDLARCMAQGAIFLFDYGVSRREYYAPDRNRGWLRCHFRHFAHDDPLLNVGIQDLTSWVDFTAVAGAAADSA
jgi:SAM-dependent MidA family methyltransferase